MSFCRDLCPLALVIMMILDWVFTSLGKGHGKRESMGEVTHELQQLAAGDRSAIERLLPLVYDELHQMASKKLQYERPNHTLQTTALVNEFFLRFLGSEKPIACSGSRQFFGLAAEIMRRLLIDSARAKNAKKRSGAVRAGFGLHQVADPGNDGVDFDLLLDLDARLSQLEQSDPLSAEIVKLRVFSGLSFREIARVCGISRTQAHDEWTYARCWLAAVDTPP
jgi:RNA polymerase sigma factor (TIGR02999 family)